MIHYKLRNNAQADGGYTDLFVLGTKRAYDSSTKTWGSDFTAAATTQSYNLIRLTDAAGSPLRIVNFPLPMVIVRYPFSNTADNPKLDVGRTSAATAFIAGTAADLETQDKVVVAAAAGVPYASLTADHYLTATITNVTNNISTLVAADTTDGVDILIYACLNPYPDFVTNREL